MWVFDVPHWSKYGFDDDSDDEAERKAPPSGKQAPPKGAAGAKAPLPPATPFAATPRSVKSLRIVDSQRGPKAVGTPFRMTPAPTPMDLAADTPYTIYRGAPDETAASPPFSPPPKRVAATPAPARTPAPPPSAPLALPPPSMAEEAPALLPEPPLLLPEAPLPAARRRPRGTRAPPAPRCSRRRCAAAGRRSATPR